MIRLKSAIMIGTIYPEFTTVPGKREKRERITCKWTTGHRNKLGGRPIILRILWKVKVGAGSHYYRLWTRGPWKSRGLILTNVLVDICKKKLRDKFKKINWLLAINLDKKIFAFRWKKLGVLIRWYNYVWYELNYQLCFSVRTRYRYNPSLASVFKRNASVSIQSFNHKIVHCGGQSCLV